MKFPTKRTDNMKIFHISGFSKGLNLENVENNDVYLEDCNNVWHKNGNLQSRPGIATKAENFINDSHYRTSENYNFFSQDITFNIEGETKNIVLEKIRSDNTAYVCLTHILNEDGSIWQSAMMNFGRLDSEHFYEPDNIIIFKGKPIGGSGIYAFVHLTNEENIDETYFSFFELDSEYANWEQSYVPYAPTVYINGRGNMYEQVITTGQVYLAEPKRLEKLNILNPQFYAYYSSDGYSSSFRLPFAELDDGEVTGRLYYSVEDYTEWLIPEGETSGQASVYDIIVTMHVNREKGIVYFTVPAGEYSIPLITDRNENNIRFSAYKSVNWNAEDISLSKSVVINNNKILMAKDNLIFEADSENPLYFPAESVLRLSEEDEKIVSLAWISGETVAFCEDKIYSVSIKDGKALNTTALLAENGAIFYSNDVLSAKCQYKGIGCKLKESVVQFSSFIYWQGTDGEFYSLSPSFEVKPISKPISSFLENGKLSKENFFGFRLEDYVVFAFENQCFLMNTDSENWYFWELPQNVRYLCITNNVDNPKLICYAPEFDVCYIAEFKGKADCYLSGDIFDPEIKTVEFESFFKTKGVFLECENTLKNIHQVRLQLKIREARVSINQISVKTISNNQDSEKMKTFIFMPAVFGVNSMDIEVRSYHPFEISCMDIKYTPLKW